jgi:hypothetical protein
LLLTFFSTFPVVPPVLVGETLRRVAGIDCASFFSTPQELRRLGTDAAWNVARRKL